MEIQLPPTDKRALGKVEDSEMENVTVRASVPGQLVERKCACWMTFTTNGSMNLHSCWKIRKTAETCLNTSNECHSVEKGLISFETGVRHEIWSTDVSRSCGKSTRQGAQAFTGPQCVRGCVAERSHVSHEGSIQEAARHEKECCEGQVCGTASGARKARRCLRKHTATCGCLHAVRIGSQHKLEFSQVHRIAAFVHTPIDELIVLIPHAGIVQSSQGLLLGRAMYGTHKASKIGAGTCSKASRRRVDLEQRVSKNVGPSQPNGHSDVSRNYFVEAPLEGLGKAETTLRNHVETKRLAVVGPCRFSDERLLKRTIRWVEHKRSFIWSADSTQAEQPIHKCLERAGTKCVTSLAVKDSRLRDGDEP